MTIIEQAKKIHFIGIGGIGMSGLAQLLHSQGKEISGSDSDHSEITNKLTEQGINTTIPQPNNIPAKTDLAIYTIAIPPNSPELLSAQAQNIPLLTYFEALGELSKNYQTIAICGTHGKSTTTALVTASLLANNQDPTVIIGTKIKECDNNNFRKGLSNLLVVEACEYRRSFLNLHPSTIIITNIEPDHLDYFKDKSDYFQAFQQFTEKLPPNGTLILNDQDPGCQELLNALPPTEKFQILTYNQSLSQNLTLQIPGKHNLQNAAAALKLSEYLQLPSEKTAQALENFTGAWRRFEEKGRLGDCIIIDDYAHHPTEIKATLAAAKEKFPHQKILAVFQPHQHSRTHELLPEFKTAFTDADEVIIPNIYSVRDTAEDIAKISAESFVKELQQNHPKVTYGNGLENTTTHIKENLNSYNIILIMGAGNITSISEKILT